MRPLSTRRTEDAGAAEQATAAGDSPVRENGSAADNREATAVTTEIQGPPAQGTPTRVDAPQLAASPDPLAAAAAGPAERGKLRRRLRRLKRVRARQRAELGTLVIDARKHAANGSRPEVVERRAAEAAEVERQVRELQHAVDAHADTRLVATGICGSCAECATLLSTEDRFCPTCGTPTKAGRRRPVDTSPVEAGQPAAAPVAVPPAPADGPLAHVDRSAIPPPPPPPPGPASTPAPAPLPARPLPPPPAGAKPASEPAPAPMPAQQSPQPPAGAAPEGAHDAEPAPPPRADGELAHVDRSTIPPPPPPPAEPQ
jgi:hypothetical protein